MGGLLLALADAFAIAITVPSPGVGLRASHHAYALLETAGLAAAGASLLFAVGRRRSYAVLAVIGLLSTWAMHAALGRQLSRQAAVLLDGWQGGRLDIVVFAIFVLGTGMSVPAAQLLAAAAARHPATRSLVLGLGAGGVVLGHAIHRDDYPELHLAIFWIAGLLLGGVIAPRLRGRGGRWAMLAAALAVGAWWLPPPNRVRVELFREPGAVAPWVLAQLAWRPPVIAAPAPAPVRAKHDDAIWQRARWGLRDDPVVVLLSIDALRADVVSDGARDRELPTLAWLRDHGASFDHAVSPGTQTSVTLTSLFAGRYYSQLRWARYGVGRTRFLYAAEDPEPRFVDELTGAGVTTTSILGLVFLGGRFGVARGFANERLVVEGRRHAKATAVMNPLLEALNAHGDGPAFFFAHLMEPHHPYDRGERKEGPAFERYVSEIAVTDRWLKRLRRVLQRRFGERGYLVVTSDHGEAFGEHGTTRHSKTLYEELVRVPLLLHGAGIPARRHAMPVSTMDVGPTLLHLFGVAPMARAMGGSLLPLARGVGKAPVRPVLAEGRLRRALVVGDTKVIEDRRRKTVEIYDLSLDPGETVNLFDEASPEQLAAAATLRRFFAEETPAGYDPPYKP